MEKLDLKKTLFYFFKKSWIIITIAFAILICGYFYQAKNKSLDIYEYNAKLYVNSPDSESFLACSNICKSNQIFVEVINDLDLNTSTDNLSKKISIKYINNSKIINITVSDTSNENAKNIANSFLKHLSIELENFILSISNEETGDALVILEDFAEPTLVSKKFGFSNVIKLLVAGFIVGISVVFVLYYFDTTIKDIEMLENNFDIPVLGKIYKNNKHVDSINIIISNIKKKLKDKKTLLLLSSNAKEDIEALGKKIAHSFVAENKKVILVNLSSQTSTNTNELDITKTDIDNFFMLNQNYDNINENFVTALLEKLEKDFDQIIIIGSPINTNSSVLLSTFIETIILSVKINCTKLKDIQNTIKNLNLVDTSISGIIVDNMDN